MVKATCIGPILTILYNVSLSLALRSPGVPPSTLFRLLLLTPFEAQSGLRIRQQYEPITLVHPKRGAVQSRQQMAFAALHFEMLRLLGDVKREAWMCTHERPSARRLVRAIRAVELQPPGRVSGMRNELKPAYLLSRAFDVSLGLLREVALSARTSRSNVDAGPSSGTSTSARTLLRRLRDAFGDRGKARGLVAWESVLPADHDVGVAYGVAHSLDTSGANVLLVEEMREEELGDRCDDEHWLDAATREGQDDVESAAEGTSRSQLGRSERKRLNDSTIRSRSILEVSCVTEDPQERLTRILRLFLFG